MSNFNKVVTNIPVSLTETEMSNLSQTFSGIIQGGGGGGEGKRYIGDGVYVTVNNDANPGVISLTQTSLDKLNKEIPSAVSSFPDSVQYAKKTYVDNTFQTKDDMSAYAKKTDLPDSITDFADTSEVIYSYINETTSAIEQQLNFKQNKLQFDLNAKGEISAIGPLNNTTALAGANGITGDYYSASNPSGFINSTQVETQILEKHYLTEASGNLLYVPIPEGLSDGQYYAMTTSSWKVIQGAGDVSGISTVAHDDTLTGNGNNENLGVDTTKIQTKLTDAEIQNITDVTTLKTASAGWDAKVDQSDLNDYLTKTQYGTDSATFALKTQLDEYATKEYANNASANALSEAEIWVENKHYLTEVPNTYALKTDIPTTIAQLTDSGNYYTKSETSGASEITNALGNKVDKPSSLQNKYLVLRTDNAGNVSGWVDFNDNVYSKSEADGRYQKKEDMGSYLTTAKYATDSATFYPTTNPDGYLTKTDTDTYYQPTGYYATSAGLTAGNQYAMTTNGWEVVQGCTSFTGVVTGTGLSGTGLSNSPLGVDTTAAIYFTNGSAYSAVTADKAESAQSAKWLREGNAHVSAGDVTALQHWASSNSSTWEGVTAKLGTAQYATDSATFVTSSSNTITGTKQYALTTAGWSDIGLSAYLPLSGGTVSGDVIVKSTGKNLLAVNTNATLMGQSRVANLTDTTAIGTNWMGVNNYGGGFLKNVQGGNVGDLDGTSIQINFATNGNTAYGNITVNSQGNESKVVHIPTASYDSMSSFDATNGPNYMLRKTASGFDIGAAVINVTALPQQTEANAYYFVYDL